MIFGSLNQNTIKISHMNFRIINSIAFIAWGAVSFSLYSQTGKSTGSKYGSGKDSVDCVTNLSLYRDQIRNRDYVLAYDYWRTPFDICPSSSKNLYIDGARIFREFLDNNPSEKRRVQLCDSLMLVYERRIEYFGENGKVRGFQGSDLLKYRRNDGSQFVKQGYTYLKESLELEKEEVSRAVLPTLISASLTLYKDALLDDNQVIEDYILVSDIIDKMIADKPSDQLIELKQGIDLNFANEGPNDCDKLVAYFSAELTKKQNDPAFLNSLINVLYAKSCTSSELYFTALKNLHSAQPTVESAVKIAAWAKDNSKYKESVEYLNLAIQLETNQNKKADYYLALAVNYQKLGEYSKAREACINSANSRPGFGDPYILIGQLYVESKNDCTNPSDNKNLPNAVFWVAVDMFNKARSVDPSVEETANKLISTYSPYFPNKEDAFFKGVHEGDTYTVGCWINVATKARF